MRSGPLAGPAGLTVAALQLASVPGDVGTNALAAAEAVRLAGARGARVAVLPELYLCGYDLATVGARPDDCDVRAADLEEDVAGPLAPLVAACADEGVLALVGAAVRHGDGRRTISLLAMGDGRVRVAYDKLHLCGDEAEYFVPGDHPAVLDVDGWRVGLSICYDGCFPEHARAVADAGALVYLASMAYAVGGEHRRDLYYRARAVENGMYVVTSGLVGECGTGRYGGGSAILDTEGRVLSSVPDGAAATSVATLDRTALEATRAAHPMYAEHRAVLGDVRFLTLG